MAISDLVYVDSTGYHYADFPTFLAYVQSQYQAIYGADVYLEADSQDGQFIATIAQGFYDCAAVGGSTYASFSPVSAQGVGLSRVVKINGLTRRSPTNSTVTLSIGGTVGTTITNGIAQDNIGQKWDLPASVIIPSAGTIDVTAMADTAGDISAAPNTITKIFTPTRGWQTVNNAAAATEGVAVETDSELRTRQSQSTANPSKTVFEGTVGAVQNVTGVTAAVGYENATNSTDGNGIPAHSISIVAAGGTDTDVAQAIYDHKGPGCGTYGTTTKTVYDDHGMPLAINFYRPTTATISVRITLTTYQGYSTDFIPLIQAEVAAAVNAFGIGAIPGNGSILLSKLYVPAYLPDYPAASETYSIVSIELKKNAGSYVTTNLAINFNEQPVCVAGTNVVIV